MFAAENWSAGAVMVALPDGRGFRLGDPRSGPEAGLIIKDYRFLGRCVMRGDVGFAEDLLGGWVRVGHGNRFKAGRQRSLPEKRGMPRDKGGVHWDRRRPACCK